MKKTLYLECYSGISGDMTVAALLGLGADWEVLKEAVESLSVGGFEIERKKVVKSGISAWDFEVRLDSEHENHDHDMEYLHGEVHGHEHEHHGHAHHEHRGMKEIREIIHSGYLTERAKGTALRIFEILAQAEAKAHQVPVEEVHFHEVGAVDSIVDIVAAAVCLDNLDITDVIVPELYEGKGTIRCQHGLLPIPVPAVENIAQAYGLTLHRTQVEGELVTPTGAAIAAALRTSEKLPERFTIEKTGIGAGKRQYECPGILRAMLIVPEQDNAGKNLAAETGQSRKAEAGNGKTDHSEAEYPEADPAEEDGIWKLETNVDDCTGEMLGFCMERLFAAGARDVHYTPVFMKKNRPAWLLTVLCDEKDRQTLEQIIFAETTTIGIRRVKMQRTTLTRRKETVPTPFGEAEVKVCQGGDREKYYPEYESLAALCRREKISYSEAYHTVVECAKNQEETKS